MTVWTIIKLIGPINNWGRDFFKQLARLLFLPQNIKLQSLIHSKNIVKRTLASLPDTTFVLFYSISFYQTNFMKMPSSSHMHKTWFRSEKIILYHWEMLTTNVHMNILSNWHSVEYLAKVAKLWDHKGRGRLQCLTNNS